MRGRDLEQASCSPFKRGRREDFFSRKIGGFYFVTFNKIRSFHKKEGEGGGGDGWFLFRKKQTSNGSGVFFFFSCPNVCLYVAAVLPTEREGKGFAWVKGQIIFEPVWVS